MRDKIRQFITIEWYCSDPDFEEHINLDNYEEQLEQHALGRIRTMREEGYISGELHTTCTFEGMEVNVSGQWEIYTDNDRGCGQKTVMFTVPTEDVERVTKLVNGYRESDMKELMDHKIDQHE